MRVLFSTGSATRYMRPPMLGDEQVICGPEVTDERAPDGRVLSLATTTGEYDLARIAAKLPPEQAPDLVVCVVDSMRRNLPRNLSAFKCPRVLLAADTHHWRSPLIGMLRYMAGEPFERIVLLYDRHHAAFLHAAGLKNLSWFPGLTFPHSDADVRAARQAQRKPHFAFVGQTGNFHPRRTRLLDALAAGGVPVAQRQLVQAAGLRHYGASLAGFNASLNGDLNLRVFEILASGAALVTDRLAPASGLTELLTERREFAAYRNAAELTAVATELMERPEKARALGQAGARWFDRHFNEATRRAAFQKLAFDGVEPFPISAAEKTRVFFGGDTGRLLQGLMVYEGIQEQHRSQELVRVAIDEGVPPDVAEMCATLPRVAVSRVPDGADLLVVSRGSHDESFTRDARRVWCWDAAESDLPGLAERFFAVGLTLVSRDVALFDRAAPLAGAEASNPTAAADATRARRLFGAADYTGALEAGRAALQRDSRCVAALAVLGDLALYKRGGPLAEKLFRQAIALAPDDPALAAGLAEALALQKNFSGADRVIVDALQRTPAEMRLLIARANVRELQGRGDEAIEFLRQAAEAQPASVAVASRLGLSLRRNNHIIEGLGWQRRALGATDDVSPIDPAVGPVRVAFVVQHPQGWTSLESVWRAMTEDPAFEPVIVAAPYHHPYPIEGGPEAIYDFLTRAGVPFTRWDEFPLEPGFADVVFVQNPYDVTRPKPLHVANLLKLVPRLAYLPYGLEIGGGERNNTMVMNMPLQQLAWLVCARSERQRQSYAKHCQAGNAHVAVTGHAKLDALRDLSAVDTSELDRFAAGRKLIGWNPHFDLRPKAGSLFGEGFSTFLRWWEFMLAEFARRPDLAFVIRPHPLFFGTLASRKLWTRDQVDAFVQRIERSDNIRLDRAASYLPLFKRADAMLSDASSFILEFAATGKPLLYLHNPDGPALNDDGAFVRDHLYTAGSEADFVQFFDQVAAGQDPRGPARRAAYADYMYQPAEGTGQAVTRAILERLGREAPVGELATVG